MPAERLRRTLVRSRLKRRSEPVRAIGSPVRVVLVELATRFAEALIEAVLRERLRELPALASQERG